MKQKKRYRHWLKISGVIEKPQYAEVDAYLKRYPDAKAELYYYEYDLFSHAVKLECGQCYDDLDMMVNSMSHGLRRLVKKPANITLIGNFYVPDYLK